jgi:hypothetical protein
LNSSEKPADAPPSAADKKKTENRYLTDIKIEECKNYSDYLPHAFPKINKNTGNKIVHPNDDPKGQYFHRESGSSGVNYSVEPNTWSDFWKTRRGKRAGYHLQYLNERRKTKARYERMRTQGQEEIRDIPIQLSYNRVAER